MRWTLMLTAALASGNPARAGDVKISRNSPALQFTYEWPAQAAAIPRLASRFQAEMSAAYRRQLALARKDQKIYREQQRTGMRDFYSLKWSLAGETPRLLSLESQLSTFTGGAHPNTNYGALIWDRKKNRQLPIAALFGRPADFPAITRATYCKRLDAERARRRQGEKLDLAEFNACPSYSDLAIAPVDKDHNGRFEAIDLIASPYLAGPYVEGEYAIAAPVTRRLIGALKAEYRSAFEAQRQ